MRAAGGTAARTITGKKIAAGIFSFVWVFDFFFYFWYGGVLN
jgi:hypothetical protein